ncbi:MAG: hypothetical protein JSV52_05585 [Candidatus Zixiibacteriota bacterium]|nr:MAG: hypothetical protein JSV52_05585 [candidate division Zixibacteria bacterium]
MKLFRQSLAISSILSLLLFTVAAAQEGGIDHSLLKEFEKAFESNGDQKSIINAVTGNDIKQLSLNREVLVKHNKLVNHKLDGTGVIDQQGSGRCWIFAGVRVLAPKVKSKLDLSDFEISEPYLTFYDKLEKANFFLERIIELRDKPLDDRSLQLDIEYFFGDGGWWHYFTDLIHKYGLVPISAMPETKQSIKTGTFNKLAKTMLRGHASQLRQMHQSGKKLGELRGAKEKMLEDIYRLLIYTYGVPPKQFSFRYEEEQDSTEQIVEKDFTPRSFFEEFFGEELPDYVTIVNNPAKDFDKPYLLEASRNIWENPDFLVLNLEIEKLKEYTLKSLLDSQAVWFSCDVGKQNLKDSGIFAADMYEFDALLNMDFSLTKAERIQYKDTSPNHAMTIVGVDTAATGEPVKWLVQNSWGTKPGDGGYWYMYDNWFDEYVLAVVVQEDMLSEEDERKLDQIPVKISDWEPFFLALRNLP